MHPVHVIRIRNASFYAYHGAQTDEQNLGGKFEVDVELHADLSAAIAHDSLRRTLDYEAVYAAVRDTVTAKRYYLIEALANTIAGKLLDDFGAVQDVLVRVRKPHPPVKGVVDFVEVEVVKAR